MLANNIGRKIKILIIIVVVCLIGLSGYGILNRDSNFEFDSHTGTITNYYGNDTNVIIPKRIGLTKVKYIGHNAFEGNENIENVTLPNGVISIGKGAFINCSRLECIDFPDSLESFGECAFDCTNLKSISVSSKNKKFSSVDGVLFDKDKERLILYPSGNEKKEYTLPNSVKVINESAFFRCKNIEKVNLPDTVTSIKPEAFHYCGNLKNIVLSSNIKSIEEGTFSNCESLNEIVIPEGVEKISSYAFSECESLSNVSIPNTVKRISSDAFSNCEALTDFTIPQNVEEIDGNIFVGCSNLKNIIIKNDSKFIFTNGTLFKKDKNGNEEKVISCLSSKNDIIIPKSVKEIGEYAFCGKDNLNSIIISSSVKKIGDGAFRGCKNLGSIYLPNSITSIGKGAFIFCENITIHVNNLEIEQLVRDSESRIVKDRIICGV